MNHRFRMLVITSESSWSWPVEVIDPNTLRIIHKLQGFGLMTHDLNWGQIEEKDFII